MAGKNVLTTPSGRASALAFMVTWRADRRYKEAYDYCAQQMQDALRPEDQYRLSSPYDLHECETTLSIEQTIIHALVTQLLEESTTLDREALKASVRTPEQILVPDASGILRHL
jgi:hypothetical protein